ncbi:hypothetical protein EII34_08530 [Arachnia propionica]|uniref:Uncharacterized protein n=1 Tax=Arachnia propionica TaxID=1750 RepID=A0A3P1T949_9ACTN|nr:hypothetical protein [Arachnia propionica]RRD04963.1 hypothetical protein EII34_08530 [Arachnia propionica]
MVAASPGVSGRGTEEEFPERDTRPAAAACPTEVTVAMTKAQSHTSSIVTASGSCLTQPTSIEERKASGWWMAIAKSSHRPKVSGQSIRVFLAQFMSHSSCTHHSS